MEEIDWSDWDYNTNSMLRDRDLYLEEVDNKIIVHDAEGNINFETPKKDEEWREEVRNFLS